MQSASAHLTQLQASLVPRAPNATVSRTRSGVDASWQRTGRWPGLTLQRALALAEYNLRGIAKCGPCFICRACDARRRNGRICPGSVPAPLRSATGELFVCSDDLVLVVSCWAAGSPVDLMSLRWFRDRPLRACGARRSARHQAARVCALHARGGSVCAAGAMVSCTVA